MSLLKSFTLSLLLLWHCSLNAVFANSGSYIAGQFAEKEGDFRNASYYYIDLISRGETEREIMKKTGKNMSLVKKALNEISDKKAKVKKEKLIENHDK